MEPTNTPIDTNIPPVPPPQPVPPPAPAPMPAPQPAPPKEGFFDGMTLVDWGILVLTSAALLSAIYYYSSKITALKTERSTTQKDINEVKTNLQNLMGSKYQSS